MAVSCVHDGATVAAIATVASYSAASGGGNGARGVSRSYQRARTTFTSSLFIPAVCTLTLAATRPDWYTQ